MGYVYFITDHHGHMKIGKADNPVQRLRSLQTGNPYDLGIYELIKVQDFKPCFFDSIKFESFLHDMFSKYRIRDEWFDEEPVIEWLKKIRQDSLDHPKSKQSFGCFNIGFGEDLFAFKIKVNRSNKLIVHCIHRF